MSGDLGKRMKESGAFGDVAKREVANFVTGFDAGKARHSAAAIAAVVLGVGLTTTTVAAPKAITNTPTVMITLSHPNRLGAIRAVRVCNIILPIHRQKQPSRGSRLKMAFLLV